MRSIDQKVPVCWSKDETCELLHILRKYPILYDPSHPAYALKNVQTKVFNQICDELKVYKTDVTPDIVRNKFTALKKQYEKENEIREEYLRKRKKTDGPYRSKLWCFDMLKFFEKETACRKQNLKQVEMPSFSTISLEENNGSIEIEDSAPFEKRNSKNDDISKRSILNKKCLQLVSELSNTFKAITEEGAGKSCDQKPQTFLGLMIESELSRVNDEIYDEAKWKIIHILEEASLRHRVPKSVSEKPRRPPVPITSFTPKPKETISSTNFPLSKGVKLEMIEGSGTQNSTITKFDSTGTNCISRNK